MVSVKVRRQKLNCSTTSAAHFLCACTAYVGIPTPETAGSCCVWAVVHSGRNEVIDVDQSAPQGTLYYAHCNLLTSRLGCDDYDIISESRRLRSSLSPKNRGLLACSITKMVDLISRICQPDQSLEFSVPNATWSKSNNPSHSLIGFVVIL